MTRRVQFLSAGALIVAATVFVGTQKADDALDPVRACAGESAQERLVYME
jgi:hypothetical protein